MNLNENKIKQRFETLIKIVAAIYVFGFFILSVTVWGLLIMVFASAGAIQVYFATKRLNQIYPTNKISFFKSLDLLNIWEKFSKIKSILLLVIAGFAFTFIIAFYTIKNQLTANNLPLIIFAFGVVLIILLKFFDTPKNFWPSLKATESKVKNSKHPAWVNLILAISAPFVFYFIYVPLLTDLFLYNQAISLLVAILSIFLMIILWRLI